MGTKCFDITLKAPIGDRKGKMEWREQGGSLDGILEIMGHRNPFSGHISPDRLVEIEGNMVTEMRDISYTARGTLQSGLLSLELQEPRNRYRIEGEEVEDEKVL